MLSKLFSVNMVYGLFKILLFGVNYLYLQYLYDSIFLLLWLSPPLCAKRDILTRLDLPDHDTNEQDLLRIYDSGLKKLFKLSGKFFNGHLIF
jgi:hypothetical protein